VRDGGGEGFALARIFAQPKSEKRLAQAESPTETLATQASRFVVCQYSKSSQ